ncbi:MAG TPA: tail fiber domain-containing protein [Chitinophagaceae bacterium]|nr:tail fiber domain-containing protein [Chitinophagaceae bacterium]
MLRKLILFALLLGSLPVLAQVPNKFNYQAVARNSSGQAIINTNISLRISVRNGEAGAVVYSETRKVITGNLGLFTVVIGSPGASATTGSLAGVDWSLGNIFLGVEADPLGGNSFVPMGNTELVSVPYAMYAVNGKKGDKGDIGATGPIGIQGSIGATGPIGMQGLTGATGPIGIQGLTGAMGLQGNQGANGLPGNQGIQGMQGPIGLQGIAGPVGPMGNQGIQGLQGPVGLQGMTGAVGATGPMGVTGGIGATGPQGLAGKNTLIKTTVEPAGVYCATGGVVLEYGIDINENGILDAGEINAVLSKYICNGAAGIAANAWGLTGNGGTNPATNFIGTTDNAAFIIKVNNQLAGNIHPAGSIFFGIDAGKLNLDNLSSGIGYQALSKNTTGSGNTAMGWNALANNANSNYNTAVGASALSSNTTGAQNTATGAGALFSNQNGNFNAAFGYSALSVNGADGNTAMGTHTLSNNITGSQNTAVGLNALSENISGDNNVALGTFALGGNIFGYQNVAIGNEALFSNKGSNNTAVGHRSLGKNFETDGNTAMGSLALSENLFGDDNTVQGSYAMYANTAGSRNVAIGATSLNNNTTGVNNTAVGYNTLSVNISGSYNTALGLGADVGGSNLNNSTAIGYNAIVNNANSMVFGDANIISWAFGRKSTVSGNAFQVGSGPTNGNGAYLTAGGVWTNASDSSKKENLTKLDGASILAKLKQLSITRWNYKGTNEYHIGPMAQDFHRLFNVGTDNTSISSIDPAGIALKAIQEQQLELEELKAMIKTMQAEIIALKKKQ